MVFISGKELVFISTMQFTSSNLENLVKNLPKDKFKYLSQEFQGDQLELVKKRIYPYNYMDSFENFDVEKLQKKKKKKKKRKNFRVS